MDSCKCKRFKKSAFHDVAHAQSVLHPLVSQVSSVDVLETFFPDELGGALNNAQTIMRKRPSLPPVARELEEALYL